MTYQPKYQATIGELVELLIADRTPIPWAEFSEAHAMSLIAHHKGVDIDRVHLPHLRRQIDALRDWVAREAGVDELPYPEMTYEGDGGGPSHADRRPDRPRTGPLDGSERTAIIPGLTERRWRPGPRTRATDRAYDTRDFARICAARRCRRTSPRTNKVAVARPTIGRPGTRATTAATAV